MASSEKLTKAEQIKAESDALRGQISSELSNHATAFEPDTTQVLKHHGIYQQDNRDHRNERTAEGKKLPKAYSMMIRTKVPGGKLTSRQLLAHLDLCDKLGDGTLRLTTRQDPQLHGVLKENLKQAIQRIDEVGLTTYGACGDVGRNVMYCPAPSCPEPIRTAIQELADQLTEALLPQSAAYSDIWLTDSEVSEQEQIADKNNQQNPAEVESLYGASYLPRKFKIGIALPEDNCIDVYTHDLGLLAVIEGSRLLGFNLLIGGGMGVTPSNAKTFPAIAKPMAFVSLDQVVEVAMAIVALYRDFGNRADRKRARLKYLVADWGVETFRAKVEDRIGRALAPANEVTVSAVNDHLGWYQQDDGRYSYGLYIESGRIIDRGDLRLKTALRKICQTWEPGIYLTAQQGLLLNDLVPEDRAALEALLEEYGIVRAEAVSHLRRGAMACVALPTCPLAVTESERALPGILDSLEQVLQELELANEQLTIRMTGCSNGCSRPYNADIGLVGRAAGKYAVYLGGRRLGDRLGFLHTDRLPQDNIVPHLKAVLACFQKKRRIGETFGDFCHRSRATHLQHLLRVT